MFFPYIKKIFLSSIIYIKEHKSLLYIIILETVIIIIGYEERLYVLSEHLKLKSVLQLYADEVLILKKSNAIMNERIESLMLSASQNSEFGKLLSYTGFFLDRLNMPIPEPTNLGALIIATLFTIGIYFYPRFRFLEFKKEKVGSSSLKDDEAIKEEILATSSEGEQTSEWLILLLELSEIL